MTMSLKDDDDVGSPVAQSTLIGDDRSIEEPRDPENVLRQDRDLDVTAGEQERLEDLTDLQAALELEEELEMDETDASADDSKGAEDYHRPLHDDFQLAAAEQRRNTSEIGYRAKLHFGRQQFARIYSVDNSKGAEDTFPPEDDLHVTAEDQQDSSAAHVDARLEVKQLEIDQDNVDSGYPVGQTVTLGETSGDNVTSSNDQLEETCDVTESQHKSSENRDDDDSINRQQETCSDKDLEELGTHDEECNLQQDRDPSFADPEPEQDHHDGDNMTLNESSENGIPLSNGQTTEIRDVSGRQEEVSCGKVLEEERSPDDDQNLQPDFHGFASTSGADPSVTTVDEDVQDNARCGADDQTPGKEENPMQTFEREDPNSDLSVVASTDQQKDIRFAEGRSEERQDHDSPLGPDLTVAVTTPNCMQLEVLSKSPLEGPESQLQVVQCGTRSSTWSADEDKSNLLCLLDSRRRTELDQDNWQLARRIEDKMAFVQDAELDDLENVQVSVKVSPLC